MPSGVFRSLRPWCSIKVDTMPVFNFDREAFEAAVARLNPAGSHLPHRRHERRRVERLGQYGWRTAIRAV